MDVGEGGKDLVWMGEGNNWLEEGGGDVERYWREELVEGGRMTGGRRGRRYGCGVSGRRTIGWKPEDGTMQVIRLLGELDGRYEWVYDVWRSRVWGRVGERRDLLRIQGKLSALEGGMSVLESTLGIRVEGVLGSMLESVSSSMVESVVESALENEKIARGQRERV